MANRYLNVDTIDAIRQRVGSGREPFASAWNRLLADAKSGLDQPPISITQNGGSPYFRQDAVYVPGRDGEFNPDSNIKSRSLATKAGKVALDLALAWRFTGEARFADKALEQIHAWCLNQNTFMMPTGRVFDSYALGMGYGGDIVLFVSFFDLFTAEYLLADYSGWNLPTRAAVKRWTRAMIDPQRPLMFYQGVEMYNNWEDARLLYLATGALLLDDLDLLLEVFARWRQILPMKMTDAGELPRETMRTRSMHYTLFALDSTIQVAEIARQCGVDLYNCNINGRCIKKAADYAAHYLLHMDQWPHKMIEPLTDERGHLGLFELAYSQWPEQQYLDVLAAHGGRSATGKHATLLFARD